MDFKKQLQEKNEFLKKAYEVAYQEYPASPLTVSLDPFEFGKSIGYNEDKTTRVMLELVNEGFVNSSIGMGMLIVTNDGLNYLRNIELQPKSIMKQSEKLDIILKGLYEYRFDGKCYSITEILNNYNVNTTFDEVFALAKKLERDSHIKLLGQHNDVLGSITTEGVAYVEDDSYSISGSPITNNHYTISIVNSPNSNLISQSSNISIEQNFGDIEQTINNIRKTVQEDNNIDKDIMKDILECLKEIDESIKNGNKPKFAIKSLLDITAGIASIASWVTVLGQFAGIIPIPN